MTTGGSAAPATPQAFFARSVLGLAVYERVRGVLAELGEYETRTTKSQVSFRRRRTFASLWLPGMYLARPRAEVVLTIALSHEIASPRFKEVAHPAARIWQHHLEVASVDDIDEEVRGWLREAATDGS